MGWKASCVLVNERCHGHLGSKLSHDPGRAAELIRLLGLAPCKSVGFTTFEEGIYPKRVTIGAYDGGAIIGDPDLGNAYASVDRYPPVLRLLAAFPEANVLTITLHSVVNLFGYFYFENTRLVRAYAGCADEGVVVDRGDLQPEERPFFDRATVRDGQRFFKAEINGVDEEFDASAFGEELVFHMAEKFFGCSLDKFDGWDLPMEEFERKKRRGWSFFGS